MLAGIDFNFERTSLGSRVAVRDDPSHARPAHCFAGADGEHEERHRQDQEATLVWRVLPTGSWALRGVDAAWHMQPMLPWWYLWIV